MKLFDDTYPHEVWNKSRERRVVLCCDVLRDQALTPLFRRLNRLMLRLLAGSRKLQAGSPAGGSGRRPTVQRHPLMEIAVLLSGGVDSSVP